MQGGKFGMPVSAIHLVREYERGNLTEHETVHDLIECAAIEGVAGIVPLIPSNFLEQIRELALTPPKTFEDCGLRVCISTRIGPVDFEKEQREWRQKWFDGIWRWHQYFVNVKPCTGESIPE
jgi:hypothetical protein